jgi:hypothetical protein
LSGVPTTAGQTAVVTCIGVNGTFDAAADWARRTALPNVTRTQDFPDDASVTAIQPDISGDETLSTWDTTEKLYGAGSLRNHLDDTDSYPGNVSNWRMAVISGNHISATNLAVGEEIWISYSVKYNRAEVQWLYDMAGGALPHQIKLGIVHPSGATVQSGSMVCQSRYAKISGYSYNPNATAWTQGTSSPGFGSDFVFQPEIDLGANPLNGVDPGLPSGDGAGSPWTAHQQERARRGGLYSYDTLLGRPDNFPDQLMGGVVMIFDWWQSLMVRARRDTSSTLLIEWYAAPLGQDWTLMYSETLSNIANGPAMLTLTNSHTDMNAEPGVRPTIIRHTDGIICRMGSEQVPAPGF